MTLPSDQTIIDPATDVDFTEEQHGIWWDLYARQERAPSRLSKK